MLEWMGGDGKGEEQDGFYEVSVSLIPFGKQLFDGATRGDNQGHEVHKQPKL